MTVGSEIQPLTNNRTTTGGPATALPIGFKVATCPLFFYFFYQTKNGDRQTGFWSKESVIQQARGASNLCPLFPSRCITATRPQLAPYESAERNPTPTTHSFRSTGLLAWGEIEKPCGCSGPINSQTIINTTSSKEAECAFNPCINAGFFSKNSANSSSG